MIPLSVPQSVVSPILVGRAALLAALDELLGEAIDGAGRTVLVAGEAGVGKSRLVAEVKRRARERGVAVVEGRCFEGDRVLPYGPLIDPLRALLRGHAGEDLAASLGSAVQSLSMLLPELALHLPPSSPAPSLDPEIEKRRLVDALSGLVIRLTATQPLLVIVEDLHWSDDTSLELLHHLARRISTAPVMLLLTYRDDEIGASLAHFLAGLDRERLATELPVARLAAADVASMVRSIFALPHPAPADLLHVLFTLTEGNPFFVEEMLKSLLTSGDISYADGAWVRRPAREWRVPRSVQDTVRRSSAALPSTARRILTLAAVVGQQVDFLLLQELAGLSEDELLAQLKVLVAAQLLTEESADRFAFRHALTREAIYTELLDRERRALHRAVAAAIARLGARERAGQVEALAYHAYEAGDWADALIYAQRAGERAQALYAPYAAVEQFTRAVEAAGQLGMAPSPQLLRARGLAYQTLGEFERARVDHEAALHEARTVADRQGEWRSLLDLGSLWTERDYRLSGDYYQRALDLAGDVGDRLALPHSLNRLANWHLNVEQPEEARRYHDQALRLFEALDHREGIAETLGFLGMANALGGDLRQSAACYERAIGLFRDLGDRQNLAYSLAALILSSPTYGTDTLVPVLALPEAARHGEEGLSIAREIGWRAGEAFAHFNLAFCYAAQGEYSRALSSARASREIAEEIGHRQWIAGANWTLGTGVPGSAGSPRGAAAPGAGSGSRPRDRLDALDPLLVRIPGDGSPGPGRSGAGRGGPRCRARVGCRGGHARAAAGLVRAGRARARPRRSWSGPGDRRPAARLAREPHPIARIPPRVAVARRGAGRDGCAGGDGCARRDAPMGRGAGSATPDLARARGSGFPAPRPGTPSGGRTGIRGGARDRPGVGSRRIGRIGARALPPRRRGGDPGTPAPDATEGSQGSIRRLDRAGA